MVQEERLSRLSVEPTVIADGTKAGENLQASVLLLPPATTTVTPAATAPSTACTMAAWLPNPPKLMLATAGRIEEVAMQVSRTAHVTVALDKAASGQVQGGCHTACEVLVGGTDTSVQHEDGGGAPGSALLVRLDPPQAPSVCLGGCLHLRDHLHLRVRLDELHRSRGAADNSLQILLGAAHLKEGHTALARVAHQVAAVGCGLAANAR